MFSRLSEMRTDRNRLDNKIRKLMQAIKTADTEAYAPEQIRHRSICIDSDIGEVLHLMNTERAISCLKCAEN